MKNCAVILAGGEGKRMKSDKPKTLSEVLGRPMLCWVMSALRKAGIDDICVVKGFKKECVEEYLSTLDFSVESVFQAERLGTGHAVMMAKDFLKKHSGNVVILNGDAPFMDSKTIEDSLKAHIENDCAATVISAKVDDPTGYGRIVRDENGNLRAIVEQKDADEETLKINEVNSGDSGLIVSFFFRFSTESSRITAQRNIIFPTQSSFCLRTEERSEHSRLSAVIRFWVQMIRLSLNSLTKLQGQRVTAVNCSVNHW